MCLVHSLMSARVRSWASVRSPRHSRTTRRGGALQRAPRPVVHQSGGVGETIWVQSRGQCVGRSPVDMALDRGVRSGTTGLLQRVIHQLRQSRHDRRDHPCRSAQLCRRQPQDQLHSPAAQQVAVRRSLDQLTAWLSPAPLASIGPFGRPGAEGRPLGHPTDRCRRRQASCSATSLDEASHDGWQQVSCKRYW